MVGCFKDFLPTLNWKLHLRRRPDLKFFLCLLARANVYTSYARYQAVVACPVRYMPSKNVIGKWRQNVLQVSC